MTGSFVYDAVRTPFGRFGKALASIRPDDLLAVTIRSMLERHPDLDPAQIDDVVAGAANQSGEDNRNVARMALLLAGLPTGVPGVTVNRLCGSSMQSVIDASRSIETGDSQLVLAGGVESMSRAPWVLQKPERTYPAANETLHSTTLGWRMINPSMPAEWTISLDGTITAGNASPLNDGACMIVVGAENAPIEAEPLARIIGRGAAAVDPDIFGIGPVEAVNRALFNAGKTWADVDFVELNEAFAAQSLACLKLWPELDPDVVNIHGGAIAIGHPLGASGGRIVGHAAHELERRGRGVAVAAICIGVGQGLAVVLER